MSIEHLLRAVAAYNATVEVWTGWEKWGWVRPYPCWVLWWEGQRISQGAPGVVGSAIAGQVSLGKLLKP